jgi:hypothetical protein
MARIAVGGSRSVYPWRQRVNAWHPRRGILGEPHLNRVAFHFDPGVHDLRAGSTQPQVLGFAFIPTGLIAKVNIETKQLALVAMTGSWTPAIGTLSDHKSSL